MRLWGAPTLAVEKICDHMPTVNRRVDSPWIVTTEVIDAESAIEWDEHAHDEHELLWSATGNVTVEAQGQVWLVPPALGIWLPAGTPHRARAKAGARTFATYVNPDVAGIHWSTVTGVSMSAALREVLLHNSTEVMDDDKRLRLQRTAVDLIVPVRAASLDIPMPRDPELLTITRRIIADPADDSTVDQWASTLNVSGRTLMRRFQAETGLSLTRWRILVRVRVALVDIAEGRTVVSVARRLGYSNPSTFIDVFRSVTGHTPAAYFRSVSRP